MNCLRRISREIVRHLCCATVTHRQIHLPRLHFSSVQNASYVGTRMQKVKVPFGYDSGQPRAGFGKREDHDFHTYVHRLRQWHASFTALARYERDFNLKHSFKELLRHRCCCTISVWAHNCIIYWFKRPIHTWTFTSLIPMADSLQHGLLGCMPTASWRQTIITTTSPRSIMFLICFA